MHGILLVVQSEENLCGVLEVLNQGVGWEELVPDEEHELQEGPELDCPAVARVLGVITGSEAEVEAYLVQVRDVAGFGVRCRYSCGHDGQDGAEGVGLNALDEGIFGPVSFEVIGEAPVQAGGPSAHRLGGFR